MNAAALPLLRATPATGHFGWDWSSVGRRLRVKRPDKPCEISLDRRSGGNPNCRLTAELFAIAQERLEPRPRESECHGGLIPAFGKAAARGA
jgi:hypothetical protein